MWKNASGEIQCNVLTNVADPLGNAIEQAGIC